MENLETQTNTESKGICRYKQVEARDRKTLSEADINVDEYLAQINQDKISAIEVNDMIRKRNICITLGLDAPCYQCSGTKEDSEKFKCGAYIVKR